MAIAAIYARFSSDKQSESSIEDQERNCLRYAERYGLSVSHRFCDRAISGAYQDRPGFNDMLAAAERGEFNILLVDDLSRLSRDDILMKQIIRRFKFRRARIVGVSDGYDSNEKGEKIQASMRGLMNELYLDDLRDKTHRGMYGKALNGFSVGGRTYGYKCIPVESADKLDAYGRPEIIEVRREINSEEARWVKQIFQWFANGSSPRDIANKLNLLEVPSPRSTTWCASTIYGDMSDGLGLLNNELYIGRYVWNRSMWLKDPDSGKRRRRKREEGEYAVTLLPELQIISSDLWQKVKERQMAIRLRTTAMREAMQNTKTRSRTGKYLFSGLLECGCCGASYTMCGAHSYGCAANVNRGEAVCANRTRLSKKLLETKVLSLIQNDLLSEEAVQLFIKETETCLKAKRSTQKPEIELHKRRLAEIEKGIGNIMAAIRAGIITPATKNELERLEAEKVKAQEAMQSSVDMAEIITSYLPQAAERYQAMVADLKNVLQEDVAQARECLKTLLGPIKLSPTMDGKGLQAELRHSTEGLINMAFDKESKVRMVAGARFELTTFRL